MERPDHRFGTHRIAGLELAFRIKGGDERRPFVDVVCGSVRGPAQLRAAIAVAIPERPRVARLLTITSPGPTAVPDQHILAGTVGALRSVPAPAVPAGIHIARATPAEVAAYPEAMERFRATSPLGAEVEPTTADDLARCAADGVLVSATDADGRWAGLAACLPGRVSRWSGQVVHELFVDEAFRGRGLAPALQRALIDALPPLDTLVGTIHHANAPSLAAARRCGRVVVGSWWWLPLAERTWLDDEPTIEELSPGPAPSR